VYRYSNISICNNCDNDVEYVYDIKVYILPSVFNNIDISLNCINNIRAIRNTVRLIGMYLMHLTRDSELPSFDNINEW